MRVPGRAVLVLFAGVAATAHTPLHAQEVPRFQADLVVESVIVNSPAFSEFVGVARALNGSLFDRLYAIETLLSPEGTAVWARTHGRAGIALPPISSLVPLLRVSAGAYGRAVSAPDLGKWVECDFECPVEMRGSPLRAHWVAYGGAGAGLAAEVVPGLTVGAVGSRLLPFRGEVYGTVGEGWLRARDEGGFESFDADLAVATPRASEATGSGWLAEVFLHAGRGLWRLEGSGSAGSVRVQYAPHRVQDIQVADADWGEFYDAVSQSRRAPATEPIDDRVPLPTELDVDLTRAWPGGGGPDVTGSFRLRRQPGVPTLAETSLALRWVPPVRFGGEFPVILGVSRSSLGYALLVGGGIRIGSLDLQGQGLTVGHHIAGRARMQVR